MFSREATGNTKNFLKEDIEKQDTTMRPAIPASEALAVTLRFLATGESYKELDFNTKLSSAFLQKNIIRVCEAIYKKMKSEFLKSYAESVAVFDYLFSLLQGSV